MRASDSSSKRLTTARSGSTAIRRAGAALRQNIPVACSQAAIDRLVRDLLLAEDRVGRRELEVRRRRPFAPGRDDDRRLAGGVDGDQRDARRLVGLAQRRARRPASRRPGERLVGEGVAADRADERDARRRAARRRRPGSRPCRRGTARASRRSRSRRDAAASSQRTTRSRLTEPTTVMRGAGTAESVTLGRG